MHKSIRPIGIFSVSKITPLLQGDCMYVTARSYLTAGVAMFGASAIALTPITPSSPMPDTTVPAISTDDRGAGFGRFT
jgi:hypothetical protein